MRNKIQKYLSGDHEGFSLVELIIVIAIMAILIGVVALAVLPYLEKSRESKDISMLDTFNSALAASVAATQVSGSDSFVYSSTAANASSTNNNEKIKADMVDSIGGGASTSFNSAALKGYNVICAYDTKNNKIMTYAGSGLGKVACLKRTTTNANVPSTLTLESNSNVSGITEDNAHAAFVSN